MRDAFVEILRDARRVPPGGIEELVEIDVDGSRQWLSIRSKDVRNPVLLFIHGGPGWPEMPLAWLYQGGWEDYFVVVNWDQRACGKSVKAMWPPPSPQASLIDVAVRDATTVVDWICNRLHQQKVFVLGHSWGTVVGTLLARRIPNRLHAYIGVGQVVDWVDNERASYACVLDEARARAHEEAIAELSALAPYPPSRPDKTALEHLLLERKWVIRLGGMLHGRTDIDVLERVRTLCPEYSDADLDSENQVVDAAGHLLAELMTYKARTIRRLDCPVLLAGGCHDFATPSSVAKDWFDTLEAPFKRWRWFERSAHLPHIEEPGRFSSYLFEDALPLSR